MREVFESSDLDAVEQVLQASYGGGLRLDARGLRGGMRVEQEQLTPAVRLDYLRSGFTFEVEAGPLGVLTIGHNRSGRLTYWSEGSERQFGAGDVGLCVQPEHSNTARCDDLDIEIAVIDPARLTQIADTAPGRRQQPVRLTGYEPVSPDAAQRWRDTFAYVHDVVLGDPEAAGHPLLTTTAADLLVASVLATFPNNALTNPTIEDRHDAHPGTLRRAVVFIDEHAQDDITIADIAAAASVTVRAVQLAFRRHLDMTPLEYLRRVRLDRAHHDLLIADPSRDTVTSISYRWGFPSASRFAVYYRRAYGVTPSHSLRS